MARPIVLIATTDPIMAYALAQRLENPCRKLGLRLEICPGGLETTIGKAGGASSQRVARAYDSAETLFDELESRHPTQLAETFVVLDVGTDLEESFAPATTSVGRGWHVTWARRTGVAAELILRFPQVFPVILSPAIPAVVTASTESPGVFSEGSSDEPTKTSEAPWRGYTRLSTELYALHREDPKGAPSTDLQVASGCRSQIRAFLSQLYSMMTASVTNSDSQKITSSNNAPLAVHAPLHFVTPLDGGVGLDSVLLRFSRGMRCWFDPTGLRTLVRNRFLGTVFGSENCWKTTQPQRSALLGRLENMVVAIDEERAFAVFNAYAAYKFGCRAWMLTTYREFAGEIPQTPLWNTAVGSGNVLILRDIDLRFPDIPDSDSSTGPELRDRLKNVQSEPWKTLLGNRPWRVRTVSGDEAVDEWNAWIPPSVTPDPGQYEVEPNKLRYVGLRKPIGTIYRIRALFENPPASVASRIPPTSSAQKAVGGHGAPYFNLAFAESLLHASRRCESGPVENLVGALLAMEAYELLLGMSRTTALEALAEQHKHEVAAEVEFPGVAHAITIGERRTDVAKTVEEFSKADRGRTSSYHAFLSQFWDELKLAYRHGEEFWAAEEAGVESLVYGKWWRRTSIDSAPAVGRMVRFRLCFKRQIVKIATSMRSLACAHLVWIFLMLFLYAGIGRCVGFYAVSLTEAGIHDTFALFLSVATSSVLLQPDGEVALLIAAAPLAGRAASLLHLLVAYVLFGILISMLYRRVTRM